MNDQADVSSAFAARHVSCGYPQAFPMAFASSALSSWHGLPYLTISLPESFRSHTRFPRSPQWGLCCVGCPLSTGEYLTTSKVCGRPCSASRTILVQAYQSLLLVQAYDLYHGFTFVHPIQLSSTHPIFA